MPGRHITDHKMRLYMKFRQTDSPHVAGREGIIQFVDRLSAGEGSASAVAKSRAGVDLRLLLKRPGVSWERRENEFLDAPDQIRKEGI